MTTSEFKTFAKAQGLRPHSTEWKAAWNAWINRDEKFDAVAQTWHDHNANLEAKLKRLRTGPVKHAEDKHGTPLCGQRKHANSPKLGRLCATCAKILKVKI